MMFDKLKQLTKDTGIYGISTIVGRFLTFLLTPFYTHVFSTHDFGAFTNLYVFIGIFNVIFIYGMDAAYLKFASNLEIGDKKDNFSTPYLFVSVVGIVISGVIYLLRQPIYSFLDMPTNNSYLMNYVIGILFIDTLNVIPYLTLRLEHNAKKFSAFKIINITVNVVLNLFLILKLKMGIEAVFLSNLAATLASFALLIPTVTANLKIKIHFTLLKRLLKFGLPYLPAGLAAMMIQSIDRPILSHLTNLSTSGLYSANYKLGIFMMLFVNMFQYAWQPFFLQNAKEKNAKDIFAKVLTYFTLAASLILVVLSLFISDLAKISIYHHTIIGASYLSGLVIVPVVLFGYMFLGIYTVFTVGIFIEEKSIYVPFITIAGAAINIGVNFWLIPIWGIMGAAFATLAAYFVMAVIYFFVTQTFYKINYEYGKIAKIFISIAIVAGIYYAQSLGGFLTLTNKFLMLLLFIIMLLIFNIGKDEFLFIKKKFLTQKLKP
ncbi:MAG: oligosaccharide flippase family protein [Bacteroidetes bacterium]|nr:oligosaccharide flippase family protein [Bacteroidota bacterium]